jgi:hypothetical protein
MQTDAWNGFRNGGLDRPAEACGAKDFAAAEPPMDGTACVFAPIESSEM